MTTRPMKTLSFDGVDILEVTDEAARNSIGTLSNLTTTNKSNVVAAVNEVKAAIPTITVDSALSTTSENPVQNKVINTALGNKQDTISDLSTIRSGASAGETAVQPADIANMQTTNNLVTSMSDQSTDTEYPSAKAVYDALANFDPGTSYELPIASTDTLGGVKVDGTTIQIDANGVISGASTYDLPVASTDTLGGVKVDGTTVSIDANGVISAAPAITVDSALSDSSENPVQNKIVKAAIDAKQDAINDLSDIRSGASAGATAVQPADLSGYALSADVATTYATKAELSTIPTFDIQVVQELPSTDIDTSTLYLLLNGTSEIQNLYDEYIYVNNVWEKLGTVAVDLSNYQTLITNDNKLSADLLSEGDANKLVSAAEKLAWSGKQDAINDLDAIRSGAAAGATAIQPADITNMQTTNNLVTSMSAQSTDTQYPSAKAVYDAIDAVTLTVDTSTSLSSTNPVENRVISQALSDAVTDINDSINGLDTRLTLEIANKQDFIEDLSTIRSGAEAGDTAVQPADIANMQTTDNLVTSISSSSTDAQYPSAKAVNDAIVAAAYELPIATNSQVGGVKVDNTSITVANDGTISATQYVLPIASDTTLGGVKVDASTINIDSNGVISATAYELPTATTQVKGGVKVDGTTIAVDANGVISSIIDSALSSESENAVQNKVVNDALDTKQDVIDDLSDIRSNASAGAQASTDLGTLSNLDTSNKSNVVSAINEVKSSIPAVDSALSNTSTNPVQNRAIVAYLGDKQDIIPDLATIRAGAARGMTSMQEMETEDFQLKSNMVMAISSDSTNSVYPSAKAVYTAINNKIINVDTMLSDSSTNPVQNHIITSAINAKQDTIHDIDTIRTNAQIGANVDVKIGELENLYTDDKTNVVAAINEVKELVGEANPIALTVVSDTDGDLVLGLGGEAQGELETILMNIASGENPVNTAKLGDIEKGITDIN